MRDCSLTVVYNYHFSDTTSTTEITYLDFKGIHKPVLNS